MISPIPPDVLSANPQFAALHKILTTELLDHDLSKREINKSYEPTEDQIHNQNVQKAKEDILKRSLTELATTNSENSLSPELRELIYVIANYISASPKLNLSEEEIDLFMPDLSRFTTDLDEISPLLYTRLQGEHSTITTLAALPDITSTSTAPESTSKLAALLSTRLSTLQGLQNLTIPKATKTLTDTLLSILTQHTAHLSLLLTHLSRHTHGTISRHTSSRSTHLLTVSRTLASKTRILALEARKSTYSASTQQALANYADHLNALRRQIEERVRVCENELRLYQECDEQSGKVIEALGRRYGEVLKEIEGVKGDIEKLTPAGGS